jgi:hypothetical protein
MSKGEIQDDSKLLSEFPFIDHANPDNNLESLCIIDNLWKYYPNAEVKKKIYQW